MWRRTNMPQFNEGSGRVRNEAKIKAHLRAARSPTARLPKFLGLSGVRRAEQTQVQAHEHEDPGRPKQKTSPRQFPAHLTAPTEEAARQDGRIVSGERRRWRAAAAAEGAGAGFEWDADSQLYHHARFAACA